MTVFLNQRQLLHLFERLSEALKEREEHADMFVVGGAAMALRFDHERVTVDVAGVGA